MARSPAKTTSSKSWITPLGIISANITLTQCFATYALTTLTGTNQSILIWFIVLFPILVTSGFFLILWMRPHVFYSPAEYGNTDPKHYADAMQQRLPEQFAKQIIEAEAKPEDNTKQFALMDSLIDEATKQAIILMHEQSIDIPYLMNPRLSYQTGGKQSIASGYLVGSDIHKKLKGTDMVIVKPDGPSLAITEIGREFATWLISSGKKAEFFVSPLGGWGEAIGIGSFLLGTRSEDEFRPLGPVTTESKQ